MTLTANAYGFSDLTDSDEAAIDLLFDEGGIANHRGTDVLAIVRVDGEIVGAVTEYNGDEWSCAVDEGCRGQGFAVAMVRAIIAKGGSGFMVAGTDEGAGFIHALYHALTADERESIDAPSWEGIEDM